MNTTIKNNPITGYTIMREQFRGKRTFTAHDNMNGSCIVKECKNNRSPNRHIIADHTNEFFYPQQQEYGRRDLRKSLSTFEPKIVSKDPLSRKISEMYGQDIKVSKSPIGNKTSEAVSPQKRRILDNRDSYTQQDFNNINQIKDKTLPSDVNWFYIDTVKHRYDYQIEQKNPQRSSYKDQRSIMDPIQNTQNNYYQKAKDKLSRKQETAQKYTYLRGVKKQELLIK